MLLRGGVVLLLLLPLGGCVGADDNEVATDDGPTAGDLSGVVVDAALRPIAGVQLAAEAPGQAARNATSDASGLFLFERLAPGAYVVTATKPGFFSARLAVEVVSKVVTPPLRLVLEPDATRLAYVETFVFDGFIECGTSAIAVCAIPNFVSLALCDAGGPCLGNLTNDKFNVNYVPGGGAAWLQSELVWTPTVSVSDQFYFSNSHYTIGQESELETVYNSTIGPSPLLLAVDGPAIQESQLGVTEGYRMAVFAAAIAGTTPPGCMPPCTGPGFSIQQAFTIYSHFFFHYKPPTDWRFTQQTEVPQPP